MTRFVMIVLAMVWSGSAFAVGVDESHLADPAQEARARTLMKELRCLVCQNQSIDESDADLAKDLRLIVRERIAAGDNDDQVKSFLVTRYGDWVLLDPPFTARTAALWLAPAGLALAAGVGLWVLARRRRAAPPSPLTAEEEARLKSLLEAADKTEARQ